MSQNNNASSAAQKNFLPQIGGLRGIAILLIVLYHLNTEWCCRGYFGVDVFFVISGYLIYSGYLAKKDTLTCASFFKARFSRLFPSVLTMLVGYHLLSAALLDPREWSSYSFAGIAALLGYANMYFDCIMGDYFAANASRYPLLHLWYISVIIHFYVLFAVVFILLKKIPDTWRWIFLLSLALVSFFFFKFWLIFYQFIYQLMDDPLSQPPQSSYYWTIGRFWECIAGMLIVYMPRLKNNALKSLLTIIGIIGIVLPAFVPLRGNMFAICGTMLIIAYVPTGFAAKILDNAVFQFLGRISFSLYLWHYVIFYIWKHYTYWELTTWEHHLCMLGVTLIVSWGAWHLIEKRKFSFRTSAICWCTMIAITFCISKLPWASDYLHRESQYRYHSSVGASTLTSLDNTPHAYLSEDATFTSWPEKEFPRKNKLAFLGDISKSPTFLMMGDSHAHAYIPGIDAIAKQYNLSGVIALSRPLPLCEADFSLDKPEHHQIMTEQVLNYLSRHPEFTTVLATCRWGKEFTFYYGGSPEHAVRRFCEEIQKMGRKLVLITDNPTLKDSRVLWYATFCRINGITPHKEVMECTEKEYYEYNGRAIAALEQLEKEGLCHLVRVEPHLFKDGVFKAITDDGTALMHDENHLTTEGALFYCRKMQEQLYQHLK